jgi:hypothetical protein
MSECWNWMEGGCGTLADTMHCLGRGPGLTGKFTFVSYTLGPHTTKATLHGILNNPVPKTVSCCGIFYL